MNQRQEREREREGAVGGKKGKDIVTSNSYRRNEKRLICNMESKDVQIQMQLVKHHK